MEKVKLNNGIEMPILGFGVYQIPKEETKQAVSNALKVRYRSIDTAQSYFNEEEVGKALKECAIPRKELFTNKTLVNIGKKHHKSSAQVILRYLIQRGVIVICKSTHIERMKENFDVFDFELSDDDMKNIVLLDTNDSLFFNHQDPNMVEWFDKMIMARRNNNDSRKDKKNW